MTPPPRRHGRPRAPRHATPLTTAAAVANAARVRLRLRRGRPRRPQHRRRRCRCRRRRRPSEGPREGRPMAPMAPPRGAARGHQYLQFIIFWSARVSFLRFVLFVRVLRFRRAVGGRVGVSWWCVVSFWPRDRGLAT